MKSINSNSWYIQIRAFLLKYNLPQLWICSVRLIQSIPGNAVDRYWVSKITGVTERQRSLQLLNIRLFVPEKSYPLLNVITVFTREASRIHARLMVATGTLGSFVLQTYRATYNQNDCDATCLLCDDDDETLSHILLECSALEET